MGSTTQHGRSPGSRLSVCCLAFPVLTSGDFNNKLSVYSCGGSFGIDHKIYDRTEFPFHLQVENRITKIMLT